MQISKKKISLLFFHNVIFDNVDEYYEIVKEMS